MSGKYLVTLGPMCQVTCLDAKTGERKWDFDLAKEFGTTVVAVLASEIAQKISDELAFPGQIQVTVIREFAAVETAN